MSLGSIEITAGAVLLWAALYYLDSGGAAPWVLPACLCHELGHYLAVRALGGRVRRLRLTAAGAELQLSSAGGLTHGRLILAALAGPAANLLLAAAAYLLARRGLGRGLYLFSGVNLGLAGFNLLPADCLDGGCVVREALVWLGLEPAGRWLTGALSAGAALLLLGVGAVLLWHSGGRNFTLLLAGLWMLFWCFLRDRRGTF